MRKNFKESNAFKAGCKMPPLRHRQPEQQFDWPKSDAMTWLIKQPEILSYIFEKLNLSGAIIYDPETGCWQGRDFK